MLVARSLLKALLVVSALAGMVGCAHGETWTSYVLRDGSLVSGAETVADFGPPSATYQTSLIQRDGSQYLVRESFANDKRVLLVELLDGRRTGRILSIHRNLMALDASGSPAWTGIEVLGFRAPLDGDIWERVFTLTDELPAPRPDTSRAAQPGTVITVRTFSGDAAVREHRMFSPTATEAPVDLSRLGSLPHCRAVLESGGSARFAVAVGDGQIVDVTLERDQEEGLTGSHRSVGETVGIPLTGEWNANAMTLRALEGQMVFEGRSQNALFTGWWTPPGHEPVEAVMGCAEL